MTNSKKVSVSSPASSGPAGACFEAQVGAHYLLTMLAREEVRGLSGTTIERVEFQRAAEGYPLDDVIIRARDQQGKKAVLEIQVKRTVKFTPTDKIFKSVTKQIVEASNKAEFDEVRYELAIAIAKSSNQIESAYQDVLRWAREIGSSKTFFERIERKGSSNKDMRSFVKTFKENIKNEGGDFDNNTVWTILRRLHILVFDYSSTGSLINQFEENRATQILHEEDARGSVLWANLKELSLSIASNGGDRNRDDLIMDLQKYNFRFAGERKFALARRIINEQSNNALEDIDNHLDGIKLTRDQIIADLKSSFDSGRYLELLGEAGVGKSGILKNFAQEISKEVMPIVLSPNRIIPGGWLHMRSKIEFDGTAEELLREYLAISSRIIFIDGIDFFNEKERITVIDLMRAAANIPSITIVATARSDFRKKEETNWIPTETLSKLGIANPVIVKELTDNEIKKLSLKKPFLAPLLAKTHPARLVATNLFRLSRLARRQGDSPLPRTEVDMAKQWWETADGQKGSQLRKCRRLLKCLATQAISQNEPLDVSKFSDSDINALIERETIRELKIDKVVFRHDILREWAIACLINDDISILKQLPLQYPASTAHARAIEILCRLALERCSESSEWECLLERLSESHIHGSWRRAAMLSLVRSEISLTLLSRSHDLLLADQGQLLNEVIRLVMAVDVQPAKEVLSKKSVDIAIIPNTLYIPSRPSWWYLIEWISSIEDKLPTGIIPDVVDLYMNWSKGMLGRDQLTPSLLQYLYKWLITIEQSHEFSPLRNMSNPFGDALDYEQIDALEEKLGVGFLLFCHRTPELAVLYLKRLKGRHNNQTAVKRTFKFSYSLAQSAPEEFADLIESVLISEEDRYQNPYRPFLSIDYEFQPPNKNQALFLNLLIHAPDIGKALIHKLIEYAIGFFSSGKSHGDDAIKIIFPKGEFVFPLQHSYNWLHNFEAGYCVSSGLMALEDWAHRRIEAGEPFGDVLMDIIGYPGSPSAYLLVAVDLILSYWPKSREAAIPFLASPQLLCIDRKIVMQGEHPLRSQKKLDDILGYYAIFEPFKHRESLRKMLEISVKHLGPVDEKSTYFDAPFMAVHALHRVNPDNYNLISLRDGSQQEAYKYLPPKSESQHFSRLEKVTVSNHNDIDMQLRLSRVFDDTSSLSIEFVAEAINWVKNDIDKPFEDNSLFKATAAMIAMRNGDLELREKSADWVRKVFAEILNREEDPGYRFRTGLHYNPYAIAFVGIIYAVKHKVPGFEVRDILQAASTGNPAMSHGLSEVASTLHEIDERLISAILRLALKASIRMRHSDNSEKNLERNNAIQKTKAVEAIAIELRWINNEQQEPSWPNLPSYEVPQQYFDHQASSLWLRGLRAALLSGQHSLVRTISRNYISWTVQLNSAGLETVEPMEWNNVFFDMLAFSLRGSLQYEIDEYALSPICSLPDESFFDVLSIFLRCIDDLFFNDRGLVEDCAVQIRWKLASRLMQSKEWGRLIGSRSSSIEIHLAPAISVLLFNKYNLNQSPNCYLLAKQIDQIAPFLDTVKSIAERGPSLFVATRVLTLLEVSPKDTHLVYLIDITKSWYISFGDFNEFWVDYDIGRRVCLLVELYLKKEMSCFNYLTPCLANELHLILSGLINLGVPEASRLEELLKSRT